MRLITILCSALQPCIVPILIIVIGVSIHSINDFHKKEQEKQDRENRDTQEALDERERYRSKLEQELEATPPNHSRYQSLLSDLEYNLYWINELRSQLKKSPKFD